MSTTSVCVVTSHLRAIRVTPQEEPFVEVTTTCPLDASSMGSAILFTDESRFSLESYSRRFLIWREPETHYHPSNISESDACGRGSVCVWGGISLFGCIDLHVFLRGTANAQIYRDNILDAYVHAFAGIKGDAFPLQNDNARPHRVRIVDDYLKQETIMRTEWPARFLDLNPIEYVWGALGRRLTPLSSLTQNLATLATALQKQWLSFPMELIYRITERITLRCMYVLL